MYNTNLRGGMSRRARAISEIMLPQETVDQLVKEHRDGSGLLSAAKEGYDLDGNRIVYEISGNRIKVIFDFYASDVHDAFMHGLDTVSKISIKILAESNHLEDENIKFQSVRGMWIDSFED